MIETAEEGYIEVNNNTTCYYNNKNRFHRLDGPALEYHDTGFQMYCKDGMRHRDDGPAVIHGNGDKEYWLNGFICSEEDFYIKIGKPHLIGFL